MDDETVQIRVHGVSGTPPRRILGSDPRLRASRSEDRWGVYEAFDPTPEGFAGLEAFNWSALTSGRRRQAVNALFAPFLFVNVSGWMQPRRSGFFSALAGAALRMAGLAATGFLAVGAVWAVYVVPSSACSALARGDGNSGLNDLRCRFSASGVNESIAFTLALVLALASPVYHLWRGLRRPTTVVADRRFDWSSRVAFVDGSTTTSALRALHVAFAAVVVLTTARVSNVAFAAGNGDRASVDPWVLGGLTALVLLVGAASFVDPGDGYAGDPPPRPGQRAAAALVLSVVTGLLMLTTIPRPQSSSLTDGLNAHFALVRAVTTVGIGALIVLGILWLLGVVSGGPRGFSALAVLALSLLTGGALAAGAALLSVELFGLRRVRQDFGGNDEVAIAFCLTGLVFALLFAALAAWNVRSVEGVAPAQRLAAAIARTAQTGFVRMIAALGIAQGIAWALGLAVVPPARDRDPLLSRSGLWFVIAMVLVALAFVVLTLLIRVGAPVLWVVGSGAVILGLAVASIVWGTPSTSNYFFEIVGLATPIGLLLFSVAQGLRDVESRRGLAILSDLAGFWPPSFHPLVPRPYAPRAIDGLSSYLDGRNADVVLAGHSQGSLLSVLAVANASPGPRLLTYGSPVGNLYRNGFPSEFGGTQVHELYDSVLANVGEDGWRNLYRATDPIGSVIEYAGIINQVVAERGDAVAGHSNYETTSEFAQTAHLLRLRSPDAVIVLSDRAPAGPDLG